MAATTSARVITFSFSWPFAARSVSSRTNNSHARSYDLHYQWTGEECQAGDAGLPAAC